MVLVLRCLDHPVLVPVEFVFDFLQKRIIHQEIRHRAGCTLDGNQHGGMSYFGLRRRGKFAAVTADFHSAGNADMGMNGRQLL